jgi:predicted nucleic acid-binding protein
MTASKSIFFDTAPFIYLIENHKDFYDTVFAFIVKALDENTSLKTSVLTHTEFGVKPYEMERHDLIEEFEDLLNHLGFEVLSVTIQSAKLAYQLRAKYKALKAMDALQLSIAICSGCQQFLTNDKRLKNISEIEIILIDNLKA